MGRALYIFFLIFLVSTGNLGADIRVATFNIAMGFSGDGEMAAALESGKHERLKKVAAILQQVRPDIVLLNEFDYDPGVDAAALFNRNYLARGQNGREPIGYAWHFRAPVNTGIDSGMDLDRDGKLSGPGDAWGYGSFAGQYGMLLLSRYPVLEDRARTFQNFPWSRLPAANEPGDGSYYPKDVWKRLRLSSKSHWDVVIEIDGTELHLLAHHPTPPVFDGPEDRNGLRNFDEIRFWNYYRNPTNNRIHGATDWLVDDQGRSGGIDPDARFLIAGDFNADPFDGDSVPGSIGQLLEADWIDTSCEPASQGGPEAALEQGGRNDMHRGHPALDTSDFNDEYTGNLRLDYLLPSANLEVTACGVFWPAADESGHDLVDASDHRLVWMDIRL
jgi:endonuclease/exonuclease/phosphatase family metal-dependent hydrolase